jgi:TPR repeat protein
LCIANVPIKVMQLRSIFSALPMSAAKAFLKMTNRRLFGNARRQTKWYSNAADQRDSYAKIELGKIYETGIVPQDPQQAAHWYSEAFGIAMRAGAYQNP